MIIYATSFRLKLLFVTLISFQPSNIALAFPFFVSLVTCILALLMRLVRTIVRFVIFHTQFVSFAFFFVLLICCVPIYAYPIIYHQTIEI